MAPMGNRFPVLDLPQSWWLMFISGQHLDSASKLSLFRACRQLSHMVMQHSHRTSLSFELLARLPGSRYFRPQEDTTACLKLLLKASKQASSVRLRLWHATHIGGDYYLYGSVMVQMGSIVCNFLQAAAEKRATNAITELQLEGATLKSILPPEVGRACPNLNKLVLCNCIVQWDAAACDKGVFHHLQSVQLSDVQSEAKEAHPPGQGICLPQSMQDQLWGL